MSQLPVKSLLLQVSASGVAMLATDNDGKTLILSGDTGTAYSPENPAITLEGLTKLVKTEKETAVTAIICNDTYTLIPSAFYSAPYAEKMLKLNVPVPQGYFVLSDILEAEDARVVYAIPFKLSLALQRVFSRVRIIHHTTVLASAFKAEAILMYLRKDSFDIVYFRNNRLQFINTFRVQSTDDVIYFTAFVLQQLQVDPGTAVIKVLTDENENEDHLKALKNYFPNVYPTAADGVLLREYKKVTA